MSKRASCLQLTLKWFVKKVWGTGEEEGDVMSVFKRKLGKMPPEFSILIWQVFHKSEITSKEETERKYIWSGIFFNLQPPFPFSSLTLLLSSVLLSLSWLLWILLPVRLSPGRELRLTHFKSSQVPGSVWVKGGKTIKSEENQQHSNLTQRT